MKMNRLIPMLPVRSMSASVEFYQKLGFGVEQRNDHWRWAMLCFGECRLMSVWQDVGSLHAYTYRSAHTGPLRARRDWFEPAQAPSFVLWWIPASRLPTIEEAKERLRMIAERGPSREAFTFRDQFPPPDGVEGALAIDTPGTQRAP